MKNSIILPGLAVFAAAALFCPTVRAQDLILAAEGRCDYQVVIPDTAPDPVIGAWLEQAARLVQVAFAAGGFEVLVVAESGREPGKPGIYLGDTAFARAAGIDVALFAGWSYIHRAVGRDVIIAGRDRMPPEIDEAVVGSRVDFLYPRVGTVKGVLDFLRQYAGARFLYPDVTRRVDPALVPQAIARIDLADTAALEFLGAPSIRVPAGLDEQRSFFIDYNGMYGAGRRMGLWEIANNYFPYFDEVYLAHSWDMAITADRDYDAHPEWFALDGGQRRRANQFCLSNPGFQETLYQWTKRWLEQGLNMVSILQPDGFRPCQCGECRQLYGVGDDWGEKLWIFHRKMAERFQRELPGRKIMLVAYALTETPPKTFDAFPNNVVIHLAGTNEDDFERWSRVKVPGGFSGNTHNWIANQGSDYTPMRTPLFVEAQVRRWRRNGVRGVARGSMFHVYGLEGPTYYVFGRMFEDPENMRAADLVAEFVEAAFGPAAPPMRRFYDQLFHGVELYAGYLGTRSAAWTYRDISGRGRKHIGDPFQLIGFLYPPSLLESLDRELVRAEELAGTDRVKARLALVRREFDWLRALAGVVHLYHGHRVVPEDRAVLERLLDAIDARNALVDGYFYTDGRGRSQVKPNPGFPMQMFPPAGHSADHLRLAQSDYQDFWGDTAINWDTRAMRAAFTAGGE